MAMSKTDAKLLKMCLSGYKDQNIGDDDFRSFSRDYRKYIKGELTFRELLNSIRQPRGTLKKAMQDYYDGSAYHRSF